MYFPQQTSPGLYRGASLKVKEKVRKSVNGSGFGKERKQIEVATTQVDLDI